MKRGWKKVEKVEKFENVEKIEKGEKGEVETRVEKERELQLWTYSSRLTPAISSATLDM